MIVENFQLDKCRGLESIVMDGSSEIIVVKASVAMVSKKIVQLKPEVKLHADVFGRAIQAKERGIILFQLRGFDWTVLYMYRKGLRRSWLKKLLSHLSDTLQTRAMFLAITDTSPYTYHQVWDNGESVEHFIFEDEIIKLESKIRQVSETYADHNALDDFYGEQGVYFPYIEITSEPVENNDKSSFIFKVSGEFDWCLSKQLKHLSSKECGKAYQLERSDFEGFDYITFED